MNTDTPQINQMIFDQADLPLARKNNGVSLLSAGIRVQSAVSSVVKIFFLRFFVFL